MIFSKKLISFLVVLPVAILGIVSAVSYRNSLVSTPASGVSEISAVAQKDLGTTSPVSHGIDVPPGLADMEVQAVELFPRMIDGVATTVSAITPFPYAVMIENHVDARPPSGLSKANVVYEAEAEGGITRFLAVFASGENISKIGPVRSARSYYIDWADEYSALYVHCGGSPQALSKIKTEGTFDFNEYFRGRYFWRVKQRRAPHNLYTSSANIEGYLREQGKKTGNFAGWKFIDEQTVDQRGTITDISVPFHRSGYSVRWEYDRSGNEYSRYHGSSLHKDEDGSRITAKNLVIQYVKRSILDDEGRISLKTYGSGKAKIFFNGRIIEGSWSKDLKKDRTFFYDQDEREIEFIRGTVWVEVVPSWYEVEVKPEG